VELHGGSIAGISEGEGLGCTFTVDLPVYFILSCPSSRSSQISQSTSKSNLLRAPLTLGEASNCVPSDIRCNLVPSAHQSRSHSVLTDHLKSHLDSGGEEIREAVRVYGDSVHPDMTSTEMSSALVRAFFSAVPSSTFSGSGSVQSELDEVGESLEANEVSRYDSGDCPVDISRSEVPLPPTVDESNIPSALIEVTHIHVLVVDDSCLNRKMMCRSMKGRCQCAGEACDGLEALMKVQIACDEGCPYHVVLMDYKMPNLDGPETARQLRSNGSDGLIVGITGMTETCDIDDFVSAGADFVLTKPVNEDALDRVFYGERCL